jgi:hypothetical protein
MKIASTAVFNVVVDAAPADPAIELERLVVGVEDQLLRLPEVGAHERHAAARQLHVCCLDRQRHTLERDRFVAPVELARLTRGKAQRYKRLRRNPGSFVPPRLDEPVHAVVRAVVAAPAQLVKQTLGGPALPPREPGFLLQDLGQDLDPLAQLRRRLNAPLVLELGRLTADYLPHRRARHRQRPYDLLDRPVLLEKRAPNLANHVHADHPPKPFPADTGLKGRDADTQR